ENEGGTRKMNLLAKMLREGLEPRVLDALDKSLAKRKEPMSVIEKSNRFRAAFSDAVDAYVAKHKCTRAVAIEKVSFSPEVSEFHRVEKLEKGYGSSSVPNAREVDWPDRAGAMPSSNYASGQPWPHQGEFGGGSFADWLESLVRDAVSKNPGMSKS